MQFQNLRFEPLTRWVLDRPSMAIIAALLLAALLAPGAKRLELQSDYRVFFSDDNPQLLAYDALQNRYAKEDTLLLTFAPAGGKVFAPEAIRLVHDLTRRAWRLPHVMRVDSITNFQHTEAVDDDLEVRDLIPEDALLSAAELAHAEQIALAEPALLHRVISPAADVTAVWVTLVLPGENVSAETPEVMQAARDLRDAMEQQYPGLDIQIAGRLPMNNGFREASLYDLTHIIPAAFMVAMLVVGLFFLRIAGRASTALSGSFAVLMVVISASVVAFGAGGLSGMKLSPVTINVPMIIATLAIADSMHIMVLYCERLALGDSRRQAMAHSLEANHMPVMLTSVTTAIGFLSLNFSDAPPFREFGNLVAFGVIAAWLLSVTLLPALVCLLPGTAKPRDAARGMQPLAEWVIAHHRPLLWGSLLLVVLVGAGLSRIQLSDDWFEYFDEKTELRQDLEFVTERLTGFNTIEFSIDSGASGAINEPEYLQRLARFHDWLNEQPEVAHVHSVVPIYRRLNQTMHGDDRFWYRLPDSRELAAQYLLLFELSLPQGLDLNTQIDIDKRSTRVIAAVHPIETSELLELQRRAQAWLATHATEAMYDEGSSASVMFAHLGRRNAIGMAQGTLFALLLISVLLALALRSARLGLISLVPNLAPAVAVFGLWGFLVSNVGIGLSVVVSMTLGIVVDYSVHFLSKYLRARREAGHDPLTAIRYAFGTVGLALIATTVVLVINFGLLALSVFSMNADLGRVTAAMIACALAADLLMLPGLLLALERRRPLVSPPNCSESVASIKADAPTSPRA